MTRDVIESDLSLFVMSTMDVLFLPWMKLNVHCRWLGGFVARSPYVLCAMPLVVVVTAFAERCLEKEKIPSV